MTSAPVETPGAARVAALLGTLGLFLAIQGLFYVNAGVFEYPLDDVYIHLAMAEQIAAGGYGVNPGEFAAASSSPLYSLLLVPLSGTDLHRFVPLLWNLLAITGIGLLVAHVMARGFAGRAGTGAILFGVTLITAISLHVSVVAATGMEHSLHVCVSLMLLVGLIDVLKTGRIGPLLIAGIVLGPVLRFEGVALSLLAALAVLVAGRVRPAILLGLAGVLPLAAFMMFLTRLGLDPLPSSVLVKLEVSQSVGLFGSLLPRLSDNFGQIPGATLAALGGISLLAGLSSGNRNGVILGFVIAAAVAAHLGFGRIGWMDRYENYILAFASMGALYLTISHARATLSWILSIAVLVFLLSNLMAYTGEFFRWGQYTTAAIHLQQVQLARFAQDYAAVPVAVNDLGRVAFQNPDYVLDLWGLASAEARDIRLDPARAQGWAAPLARAQGVELTMVYDTYLPKAPGEGWVRLGTLDLLANRGMVADRHVAFYATDKAHVAGLRAALEDFVHTLPEGAAFTFEAVGAGQDGG